jgi:hypothetical protein
LVREDDQLRTVAQVKFGGVARQPRISASVKPRSARYGIDLDGEPQHTAHVGIDDQPPAIAYQRNRADNVLILADRLGTDLCMGIAPADANPNGPAVVVDEHGLVQAVSGPRSPPA